MGLIALEQKEPAAAESYFVEALKISREIKDPSMELKALGDLAMCESAVKGDYAIARHYHEQVYSISREIGDRNAEAVALQNLGFTAGLQGDFVVAHRYNEQSLLLARETGSRYLEAYTLINLSAVAQIQNNATLALQYAQEAFEIARKIGERSGEAWAMLYMGHAYLLVNELEQAHRAYQKSVEIRNELGQPSLSMEPLAGLVDVALRMKDPEAASQVAEKIFAHFESGGTLEGTDEPLRVYYTCYLFLKNQQDPRSTQVLQVATQLLEMQVSKFKDEQVRKMYVENVPWRLALYKAGKASNQSQ